jgi:hypothetical protein
MSLWRNEFCDGAKNRLADGVEFFPPGSPPGRHLKWANWLANPDGNVGSPQLLQRREDLSHAVEADRQDPCLRSRRQKRASGARWRQNLGPASSLWENAENPTLSQRHFSLT